MSDLYDDHGWVYDAAFGDAGDDEIGWLMERLGNPARVLEPGCGSGRLLAGFARRGVEVAGVDGSLEMLRRACERLRDAPAPRLVWSDMVAFSLGERFDGAVCPINTFSHLQGAADALAHLRCLAEHLESGAAYMVQLDLRSLDLPGPGDAATWQSHSPEGLMACRWSGSDVDPDTHLETQVSRFEFLDGPHAGEVYEDRHTMRRWTWPTWRDLIERSPFEQVAAYDGMDKRRPPLEVGPELDGRELIWHELRGRSHG